MKAFKLMMYALLLMFAACSDGGSDEPNVTPPSKPDTNTPTITFDAGTNTKPVVATEGGTSTIIFTATQAWTASVSESRAIDWISVSPTNGGAGKVTLTITTKANDTYDERNASITLSAGNQKQTITVSQKQKDALTVTSNKVEMTAEGGTASIEVKANVNYTYEIEESAQSWITKAESRGLGTTTIALQIAENGATEKREGKVIIKSGAFSEVVTIYQAGNVPTIVLTQNEYTVKSEGETIKVELKSNVEYEMELPKGGWITETTESRAFSTHTHYFIVAPNEEYDARTDSLFFINKDNGIKEKVTITQVQQNAILVAQNEYSIAAAGGALDFSINTNVDFTVSVSADWITQVESRGLTEKPLHFDIAENASEEAREGKITITDGEIVQEILVKQEAAGKVEEQMREALIAFYKATNGDNWENNNNWCSDKPITEWYGISENGHIRGFYAVDLNSNNLKAELNECLKHLYGLPINFLRLDNNNITGYIPNDIDQLKHLYSITLGENAITGEIPESICNLPNLEDLSISICGISGQIPRNIGNLKKLAWLSFANTNLSGTIPESICEATSLRGINLNNTGLGSGTITGTIPENIGNLVNLLELGLMNNQLTGNLPVSMSKLKKCTYCALQGNRLSGHIPTEVSSSPMFTSWITTTMEQQEGYELTFDAPYTSTDFSKDKEVILLQKHTKGNGIPVIIMGDAFVDKDMNEGGLYETTMKKGMEAFFSKEPTKSLRDHFDVYSVKAVSSNNYMSGNTALGTYYDGHTDLGGDYDKCMSYARLVREDLSNIPVIVMINTPRLSIGICHYLADRFSITFISAQQEHLNGIISHETVGHGLSYLGDEYWMHTTDPMTEEQKQQFHKEQEETGWALNIDVTNDPEKVRWSKFIKDERYKNEEIGIFEGGLGVYRLGVYRPSEWSLMNASEDGQEFNAPSREIIYRRIMKLAYGDSWEYDYETFVKWDMEHYPTNLQSRTISKESQNEWMKNHRPPVFINRTSADILKGIK